MKLVNTLCNKLFLLKSAGYEYTTAISEKDQVEGQTYSLGDIKSVVTHEQMEAMEYEVK